MPCTLVTWHGGVAMAQDRPERPAWLRRLALRGLQLYMTHSPVLIRALKSHSSNTAHALHNPTGFAAVSRPLRSSLSSLQLRPAHWAAATC